MLNLLEHPGSHELGTPEPAAAGLVLDLAVGLDVELGAVTLGSGNIAGVGREACFLGRLAEEPGIAVEGRRHGLVIVPQPKDEADTGSGKQLDKRVTVSQQKTQVGSIVLSTVAESVIVSMMLAESFGILGVEVRIEASLVAAVQTAAHVEAFLVVAAELVECDCDKTGVIEAYHT